MHKGHFNLYVASRYQGGCTLGSRSKKVGVQSTPQWVLISLRVPYTFLAFPWIFRHAFLSNWCSIHEPISHRARLDAMIIGSTY